MLKNIEENKNRHCLPPHGAYCLLEEIDINQVITEIKTVIRVRNAEQCTMGTWLIGVHGGVGQSRLHWGKDVWTKIDKIPGIYFMTVGAGMMGWMKQNWGQHLHKICGEWTALCVKKDLVCSRTYKEALEAGAEYRVAQDEARKVDRNQNIWRLVSCTQN